MTTAANLITNGQTILADPSGDRWPDTELLVYLAEGLNEFYTDTRMKREIVSVADLDVTADGIVEFATDLVRTDIYELLEVQWGEVVLIPATISEFRGGRFGVSPSSTWQSETGTPVAYTTESVGANKLRLFPTPTETADIIITYVSVPVPISDVDEIIDLPAAFVNAPMYWMLYMAFAKEPDTIAEMPTMNQQAKFYFGRYQQLVAKAQRTVNWGHGNQQYRILPRQF